MTVFAFWNVARRASGEAIGRLCHDHDVDVLLLAEADGAPADLAHVINRVGDPSRPLWEVQRFESRLRAFTRFAPGCLTPAFDDRHVKMMHLRPPIGRQVLVVAAHLPSKLYADDDDQSYRVRQMRIDIEAQERLARHSNTLILGDLNADPYEPAIAAADGLHGVMDKEVALRRTRTVQGQTRTFFYNPMWSRLGDDSHGPPGTYWYPGTAVVSHFWHTFDQVLLRPDLLPCYDPARLIVPRQLGDTPILSSDGGAGLSDHLPLVLDLNLEKGTVNG